MPTIKFYYGERNAPTAFHGAARSPSPRHTFPNPQIPGKMNFWRAECIRLAFHTGDVPFEDVRDQTRADLTAAGKMPFGGLPVMEVDGKMLCQTQAMTAYAGKMAGIHPADPFLAAKVDEAINGCTDVTMIVRATFDLPADDKIPKRVELIQHDGKLFKTIGGEKAASDIGACH